MMAERIYFLVFCTFVVCKISDCIEYADHYTDYCTIQNGCPPGRHVMCLHQGYNETSSSCGTVGQSGIEADSDKISIVNYINKRRRQYISRPNKVVWNVRLARIAQRYANMCTTSKLLRHCNALDSDSSVFQYIYKGKFAGIPSEAIKRVVPRGDPLFLSPERTDWELINQVGCGRTLSTSGNYFVCNFGVMWFPYSHERRINRTANWGFE